MKVIFANLSFMNSAFKMDPGKFTIKEWVKLLTDSNLYSDVPEKSSKAESISLISNKDILSIFCASSLLVVNEDKWHENKKKRKHELEKNASKTSSFTETNQNKIIDNRSEIEFVDFIEALCRLANEADLPSLSQVKEIGASNLLEYYDLLRSSSDTKNDEKTNSETKTTKKEESKRRRSSVNRRRSSLSRKNRNRRASSIAGLPKNNLSEEIKKDEEEIEKDETEKDLEYERERFAEKLVLFLDYFFSQLAISYKGDITFQGKKFSLKCFLTEAQLIKYGL